MTHYQENVHVRRDGEEMIATKHAPNVPLATNASRRVGVRMELAVMPRLGHASVPQDIVVPCALKSVLEALTGSNAQIVADAKMGQSATQ